MCKENNEQENQSQEKKENANSGNQGYFGVKNRQIVGNFLSLLLILIPIYTINRISSIPECDNLIKYLSEISTFLIGSILLTLIVTAIILFCYDRIDDKDLISHTIPKIATIIFEKCIEALLVGLVIGMTTSIFSVILNKDMQKYMQNEKNIDKKEERILKKEIKNIQIELKNGEIIKFED
ncbi:hypothetical protein [Finegoldia magna]|uniref:hypothetical protein n=1 Tax=Finegoldia magna TaxID=1260 RepID=UPI002903286C|nr:hypothetical protein [Finegoldia magna]MDU1212732.1 hypothetical protein [Finegoldia magna]